MDFKHKVSESTDLTDELQNLVIYLKDQTNSTAVYIGKVVKPLKKIKEGDNDTAHLNPDAQPEIQFLNANNDH